MIVLVIFIVTRNPMVTCHVQCCLSRAFESLIEVSDDWLEWSRPALHPLPDRSFLKAVAKLAREAFKETNSLIRVWSDDTSVAAFDADSFNEKW